jgi:hypothetical protein
VSYFRRGYSWEQVTYLEAPVGGWNPDGNPWELPTSQAVVLDNALVRPGRVAVRGSLINWADLSAITTPGPPLNVCGVQPVPGTPKLAIGRKAISATAFVDPWFAPIVRPTTSGALAAPTADLAVALGGTSLTNTATAANLIPGPRGISFEGTRYYIGYGTLTAPVADAGGTFFAQSTNLCTLNAAGTVAAMTNAPRGAIDLKGYQSRIWLLGGIDDPGSGTTFNALALFFTNPIGPGGGNAASFADWKDPVSGLTNKILMDGDTTDPGVGMATVRNGLLIFRQQSIWILRGSTTANYALVPVSRQVGCVDPRSIVETDKGVYFMSTQGLMITDGVTVRNASGVALHTLQSAVQVVTAAITSSFGGYVTCAVASGGQLVISMGIASVTSAAPDGHIQPVWCGMYDPDSNSWTRITSSLFASDGTIIVPGNNYPGWVFGTPDQRLLSIGDKYVTQWEAASSTSVVSALSTANLPAAVTNDASVGLIPWVNPANAEAQDGVYATADDNGVTGGYAAAASQTSSGHQNWTPLALSQVLGPPDGTFVSSAPALGNLTETLQVGSYGFAVPDGSIILGIQATIEANGNQAQDAVISLMKAGVQAGSNKAVAGAWAVPNTSTRTYGNSTDLWGTTWTPSDINNSGFGLALQAQHAFSAPGNPFVGSVAIVVWYLKGTQILKATNYGFAIPSNATISGIQINVQRVSSAGTMVDTNAQVYKAGTIQAANRSTGAVWPTTPTLASFGGSSDLWGTTWAPSDINNSGFGAGIAAKAPTGTVDTASVDSVSITVYYTVASITHQQSFVKVPALYDKDAAGNFQPIPFRWLTRLFPIVGTSTLMRKFGQMKRWFCDYVFQGIGLPSANGFTVKPVDSTITLIPGSASVQLAPTNNSMTSSSISGGQPNASTSIERSDSDLFSEVSDLAFDVTWTDAQQSSQPSFVAAELYGIGIEYQPGRDLR